MATENWRKRQLFKKKEKKIHDFSNKSFLENSDPPILQSTPTYLANEIKMQSECNIITAVQTTEQTHWHFKETTFRKAVKSS